MITLFTNLTVQLQVYFAAGLAAVGMVWAAKVATSTRMGIVKLVNTPGLVELLCIAILVWLVAKWRVVSSRQQTAAGPEKGSVE